MVKGGVFMCGFACGSEEMGGVARCSGVGHLIIDLILN